MNKSSFVVLISFALVITIAIVVIFFARGYQVDFTKKTVSGTGILVATSDPDGAEVLINGKLKTATNNTINLEPGKYTIRLEKDGFSPWEKLVNVKREEVFKTNAFLFPRVPDLRPLTFTGASNPTVSPDGTKIVYSVASASAEKNGVWIADISRSAILSPLGSPADLRQIVKQTSLLPAKETKFWWSPDSKEIIAYTETPIPQAPIKLAGNKMASLSAEIASAYVLETDRLNLELVDMTRTLETIRREWETTRNLEITNLIQKLPTPINILVSTSAANFRFSPDQTKILYDATSSASLPMILTSYLPGSVPTPENRQLEPGKTYVYDTKEDKNFQIENCRTQIGSCIWFPSSRHLLSYTSGEISIMEYDGTNQSVIYGGPFTKGVVFPWPNWGKIVILTSLNTTSANSDQNLYTINLR